MAGKSVGASPTPEIKLEPTMEEKQFASLTLGIVSLDNNKEVGKLLSMGLADEEELPKCSDIGIRNIYIDLRDKDQITFGEYEYAFGVDDTISQEQYQGKREVILRNNRSTIFSKEDKLKKY